MFFEGLEHFGDAPALINAETGETVDYAALADRVAHRIADLGERRSLVFLQAANTTASIIDYLACLRAGHVVYLLEDIQAPKTRELITAYGPNLLIDGQGAVIANDSRKIDLHPDLALLLSTSGSTGSPKFVKLSRRNLDSNARSIAEYLELGGSERALQHLKPHYSYGLSIINSHLACGGALVLTDATVLEDAFWEDVHRHKATSFAGVPYTFETLLHRGFQPDQAPSLRYVTQAGGKLEARLVKQFAHMMASAGKRFYVMYGQTEAAPRISYLPPDMAEHSPDSIGRAIPGGALYVIDETGARIETDAPGELVYEGPNVMMGYATGPDELASDETPPRLLTGDIALMRDNGLFYIVGRSSRFVKPFGVRVNLDEVQSLLKADYPNIAVTGDDHRIVIAVETPGSAVPDLGLPALAQRFGMPLSIFSVKTYAALPLLSSGKYDFQAILKDTHIVEPKKSPLGLLIDLVFDTLGLNQKSWNSILEIYRSVMSNPAITENDSFSRLAGDSLSFVGLAIALEDALKDDLPSNWTDLPIRELEGRYQAAVNI